MSDLTGLRLVSEWRRWLVATGRVTDRTAHAYARAVVAFLTDAADDLDAVATIPETVVVSYLASLSPSRRNDVAKALTGWLRYLSDRGFLAGPNPARDVVIRRVPAGAVKAYSVEECRAIMDAATRYPDERAHPALVLMWTTGTRVGALVGAVRDDIDLVAGRARWSQAKAGRVYESELHPSHSLPAAARLCDLHDAGYSRAKDGSRQPTLLGVGAESVRVWMRRVIRDAGLPADGRGTPHTLRRSFATHLADEGVEPFLLMSLMGWVDVGQASRYIRPNRGRMLDMVGRIGASSLADPPPELCSPAVSLPKP